MSMHINVWDTGAVGDGSTDNTAAIQKAFDIVRNAGGGVVFIPAGRYVTKANLMVGPNTVVQGAGWKQTILAPDPRSEVARPLLVGTDPCPYGPSNHVTIRDLQVDGGDPKLYRQGIAIVGGSNYVTIERCWLRNLGMYGIMAGDVNKVEPFAGGLHGIVIRGNHVDMTGAKLVYSGREAVCSPIGIEVFAKGSNGYNSTPGVLVEANTVVASADDGMICGIKVSNQSGARILHNRVTAPTKIDDDPLHARSGAITVTTSRDTHISGNVINGGKHGIGLMGDVGEVPNGAPNEEIHILANSIRGYAQHGIYCARGFSGLLIQSNTVDTIGDASQGVRLEWSVASLAHDFTRLTLVENRLRGGGIDVVPPCQDGHGAPGARVVRNQFDGTSVTPIRADEKANHGISSTARFIPCNNPIDISGSDVVVQGNHIEGCVSFGISVAGARPRLIGNVVIDGNLRNDDSGSGIHIVGGNGALLSRNVILNNPGKGHTKYGLFLNSAVDATYADNLICGMEAGDIWSSP